MKQDITGRVLDRVVKRVMRILDEVERQVPLGPTQIQMSEREFEQEIAKGGVENIGLFRDQLDDQQITRIMDDVRKRETGQ